MILNYNEINVLLTMDIIENIDTSEIFVWNNHRNRPNIIRVHYFNIKKAMPLIDDIILIKYNDN